MNNFQPKKADTSTSYKILLVVSFHCVYRNSSNAVLLNIRKYLSNSFIHIKEYRDYGNTRRITHDHGNNINSIGIHVRNKNYSIA